MRNNLAIMHYKSLKTFFILIIFLSGLHLFSQGIYNNGATIVVGSGANVIISGGYLNDNAGSILLDGIIKLTGIWTNNTANIVIANANTTGEVVFSGSSLQNIGGSTSDYFAFPKITINTGASVQVAAGKHVTVKGTTSIADTCTLILQSTTGSQPIAATFIDNGFSGSGTAKVKMCLDSCTLVKRRYWYFSSPVADAKTDILKGALSYRYTETTSAWVKNTNYLPWDNLSAGRGYSIQIAKPQTYDFVGVPNTGNINIVGLTNSGGVLGGYNLVGNPYPSYLNWDAVAKSNLAFTITFRTRSTIGNKVYDTWDGETGTSNNGNGPVDGIIAPMQSFWVQVNPTTIGSVSFTNAERTHTAGNHAYLKGTSSNNFFRIALSDNSRSDELIIKQGNDYSDSFDSYDSRKMFLNDSLTAEIYTYTPTMEFIVIQAVKPILSHKAFDVGCRIPVAGIYKFTANLTELSPDNSAYLEDTITKAMHDLRLNAEYTFTTGIINDSSRFKIHIYNLSVGVLPENEKVKTEVYNQLRIFASSEGVSIQNCKTESEISMYTILGEKKYHKRADSDNVLIPNTFKDGCYIIKVDEKAKKIILHR